MKIIAKIGKGLLSTIGRIIKVTLEILAFLMVKGLIMLLFDGWIMIIAYVMLIATVIVLLTNKVKKNLRKESK